jgi:hypothetical protein
LTTTGRFFASFPLGNDQRQVLAGPSRQGQVAVDREAVARLVFDRLHRRHLVLRQPGRDVAELGELFRLHVEEIPGPRRAIVVSGDDQAILVVGHALQRELVAGKLSA